MADTDCQILRALNDDVSGLWFPNFCSSFLLSRIMSSSLITKMNLYSHWGLFLISNLPSPPSVQPPFLSLRVSWRQWVLTEGASCAGTPASPILICTRRPYQTNCSSLVASSSPASLWVLNDLTVPVLEVSPLFILYHVESCAVSDYLQIALGECYRVRFRGVSSKAFVRNLYVSCLYKELGCFLFGCCVGQSLTNMAKLSVGRLRPHFLNVCGVTYASLNCTPGTYVATVNCRQPDHRLEEEARCVCVCLCITCHVSGFCSLNIKYFPIFLGSPSTLATLPSRCTQCCI